MIFSTDFEWECLGTLYCKDSDTIFGFGAINQSETPGLTILVSCHYLNTLQIFEGEEGIVCLHQNVQNAGQDGDQDGFPNYNQRETIYIKLKLNNLFVFYLYYYFIIVVNILIYSGETKKIRFSKYLGNYISGYKLIIIIIG